MQNKVILACDVNAWNIGTRLRASCNCQTVFKEEQMLKDLYRKDLDAAKSSSKSLVQAKVYRLTSSLFAPTSAYTLGFPLPQERYSFVLVLVDGDCMPVSISAFALLRPQPCRTRLRLAILCAVPG